MCWVAYINTWSQLTRTTNLASVALLPLRTVTLRKTRSTPVTDHATVTTVGLHLKKMKNEKDIKVSTTMKDMLYVVTVALL